MRQFLCAALLLFSVGVTSQKLSKHVNPFIGTGGHGHTFPGATLPFGMVQLSPDTRIDGSWDGCGGYHYSDSTIYGFSHTHLNGTGVSDFGDIMLMPTMGEANLDNKVYSSPFSHANESASAGYYSVLLDDHGIRAELTTTTRVGMHRYTFSNSGNANIILDLNHRDKLLAGEVRIIDNRTIEVMRRSEAWARDQYVYARIEFSKPMTVTKINNNAFAPAKLTDKFIAGSLLSMSFSAKVKKGEKLMVKVALSPTGFDGAAKNASEISGWSFDSVKKDAGEVWDKALSKILIDSNDSDKLAVFYTALYHTMMQPNIAQDIDKKYRGRDNEIHTAEGFDYYSVFSLWDTFRAAHPLYTLIERKRTSDFINTFLKQYEQGGRLPVWELASNETDCMIGYHSVSVIADAMARGITGFDYEKAFEAAKHSAMLDHLGLEAYKKNGFISIDDEHESVSKTLEYAYDDWCIAQMALMLDKDEEHRYFSRRAQNWKNIFDPALGFMRPKKNGGWENPFDPREVNNNFTEGNSWQYSFFVPQDIAGMIDAYGGSEAFDKKLDAMFLAPSVTTGREQVDITGLIGQYAHGNEPSHHMAWLYDYIGKPEKTAAKVSFILDNFYKNSPDGLIGNEDCGQMSAWYVLSTLGLYNVTPAKFKDPWTVTKPSVNALLHFEDGSLLTINSETPKAALQNLGNKTPVEKRVNVLPIIPVPVFEASKSFTVSNNVKIESAKGSVYYRVLSVDGQPDGFSIYKEPLTLTRSARIQAFAKDQNLVSDTISAEYFKKPNDYSVILKSEYNKQYHGGGPDGLVDGIYGSSNWRKGDWQGYQSQDFEAIIDLKQKRQVGNVAIDLLQDSRSWILMPSSIEFLTSDDGITFIQAASRELKMDPKIDKTFTAKISLPIQKSTRYLKVRAVNFGKLPDWHQGAGGDAFIFVDEIEVN